MMSPSGSHKRSAPSAVVNERPLKQQPTITMETVPDDLHDDAHKAMDEKILDNMGDDPYIARDLLTLIVENSDGLLDQQYISPTKARTFIKENPKLKEILDIAWEYKSFRTVRNLSLWA
jgi:hypothetical protein